MRYKFSAKAVYNYKRKTKNETRSNPPSGQHGQAYGEKHMSERLWLVPLKAFLHTEYDNGFDFSGQRVFAESRAAERETAVVVEQQVQLLPPADL